MNHDLPPLRPHQATAFATLSDKLGAKTSRVIVHGPTGSGKSRLMAEFLKSGRPQILFTHRRALLDQLSNVLTAYGIPHGFRASGKPINPSAPVQLAMIQSEHTKCFKQGKWPFAKAEIVHVDEPHAQKAAVARDVIDSYHALGASVLGYTATPDELGHMFDDIVLMGSVPKLIAEGYLVKPKIFAPDGPSVDRLENVARSASGDFQPGQLAKIWQPKVILGRVLEHYQKYNKMCGGRPAIGFAPGVQDSLWFAERFVNAGISAAHIDGNSIWLDGEWLDSTSENRELVFSKLAKGEVKVLWNRFVLREGVDIPNVGHLILATVFGSRQSYVQSCGRGLRAADHKKFCVIQDHGGNAWRFPELDSEEPWDIYSPARVQAARRRDGIREHKIPEPITCPQCDYVRPSGDRCPECNFKHQTKSRRVIQLDGSLKNVTGSLYPPERTQAKRGDAERWYGMIIGAKKKQSTQTLRQKHAFYAVQNQWRFLPRKNFPGMPREGFDHIWDWPIRDIEFHMLEPPIDA